MRISDWSSDVCSSDLHAGLAARPRRRRDIPDDWLQPASGRSSARPHAKGESRNDQTWACTRAGDAVEWDSDFPATCCGEKTLTCLQTASTKVGRMTTRSPG